MRYDVDELGLAQLARSREAVAGFAELADEGAELARQIAPEQWGDYRDGIDSAAGVDEGEAIGRIIADHFDAHLIEFGTVDTPVFAPLRRAVDELGLELVEE